MAPAKRAAAASVSEQEKKKAVAEKFIPLFVSQPLWLMEFLEFIIVNGRCVLQSRSNELDLTNFCIGALKSFTIHS